MKNYLELIPVSARVHKRQNKMTLLCISIAVFLVTAIFSVAEAALRMEMSRLEDKHGNLNLTSMLNSSMGQTLSIVSVFLFAMVLMASVLMISGSLNSNVAQRTRFFGMMRCIGMSKKQIAGYVRLEALNWCKSAIPAGLAAGIVASWLICAVLRLIVGEEFAEISVFGISFIGIISGVLVGVIAVLIAAGKPAKRAASVSPVAAINGNTETKETKAKSFSAKKIPIEWGLGIRHAVSSKKNLFLMAGSFALSIILLFSFIVFVDLVNYLMPQSHSESQAEIVSEDAPLQYSLKDDIGELKGVENVYGRRSALDENALINGQSATIDIISFDDFEIECLKKDHELKSGSSAEKVCGNSNYVLCTWDKTCSIKIGDKITIGGETFEIAGLLKYDPFSSDGMTGGRLTLIMSDETFAGLTGENGYNLISIKLNEDATDETIEDICTLVGSAGTVNDKRDDSTYGTYMAFMLFVYSFLAIISCVTLLNIINSISLSVSARIKQYGAMRAVGMSLKQIMKMITAEALAYAVTGSLIGVAAGLVINRTMWSALIESHFEYAVWRFPFIPVIIIICFVIVSALLSTFVSSGKIRNMAIVETINEL